MSPFSALKFGRCPPAGQSLACDPSDKNRLLAHTVFLLLAALLLVSSHWPGSCSEWCGGGQSHSQQQHVDNLHTAAACQTISDEDENSFVQISLLRCAKTKNVAKRDSSKCVGMNPRWCLPPRKFRIPAVADGTDDRQRSCSLTKFCKILPLVLLYSVVVKCRGCVYSLTHAVIDSLIPTLIHHLQRQIYFLFTGDATLGKNSFS